MELQETQQAVGRLNAFIDALREYNKTPVVFGTGVTASKREALRKTINEETRWVRQQVIQAGCGKRVTIAPPPAVGGLIFKDTDPFDHVFEAPYGMSLETIIIDMVQQTIGVLRTSPADARPIPRGHSSGSILETLQEDFVFIAMPMNASDKSLDDVLDAIKEAAGRCSLLAERIDDQDSNERITDRILVSIQRARFVVVDLTQSRPNVYWEAGYAHALGKIPIYIAKSDTKIEFDLKDYPVIFFDSLRKLKDALESRFRALGQRRLATPGS